MMLKKTIIVVFLFAGVCVAAPASKGNLADTVALKLPGDVKLEMVRIPAGSFMMGSGQSERGRYPDEGPVHKVTIGYDFCIGKFEVTQAQWMSVMDKNPAYRYGIGDNYPVSHVSWDLCQQFIAKTEPAWAGDVSTAK